jgi:hypothetical protein
MLNKVMYARNSNPDPYADFISPFLLKQNPAVEQLQSAGQAFIENFEPSEV